MQDIILKHQSLLGNEGSGFKEDSFANPRLKIGFAPRGMPSVWSKRLTVTEGGLNLRIKFLTESQVRKSEGARTKFGKDAVEESMRMSQLLISLASELQEQMPVKDEDIWKQVFQPFLDGDYNLELELQSALSEYKSDYAPADLKPMKELLAQSIAARDGTLASTTGTNMAIPVGDLEKQSFQVALQGCVHDVNLYAAWKTRCLDRENAIFFQKLQHLATRQSKAHEIAGQVLNKGHQFWAMTLETYVADGPTIATANQAVHMAQKQIASRHQLKSHQDVSVVSFCNWAYPGAFMANTLRNQISIVSASVNQPGAANLCLLVMPSWHYQRGHLWKAEEQATKLVTGQGLNMDLTCCIAFEGKRDEREKRSLVYNARILLPQNEDMAKGVHNKWRSSPLFQRPLVSDCALLPTREMQIIEDIRDDALPDSTMEATHMSQGEKHQQLGADACRKCISSLMTGLTEQRGAFLLLDATTHTLDMAKAAYMELASQKLSMPLYYLGFSEGMDKHEWAMHHMKQWLASGFLDGSLPLPHGALLPAAEMAQDVAVAAPPKPELTTLVWSKVKSDGLQSVRVPEKLMGTWHDHGVFGAEFQAWLSDAATKIPLNLKENKDENQKNPQAPPGHNKRAESGDPKPNEQPKKRGRMARTVDGAFAPAPSIRLDDIPQPLTWEADLPKVTAASAGCQIVIAVGLRVFLVNPTDAEKALPSGLQVAGFYKGQFLFEKKAEDRLETDVPFAPKDAGDTVLLNQKPESIGNILAAKRQQAPLDAQVVYFDVVDAPTASDSSFFTLKQKYQVLFRSAEAPIKSEDASGKKTVPANHLAGCIKPSHWESSVTTMMWSVAWKVRGLTPVRPSVVLTQNVKIPAKSAVEITSSTSSTSASVNPTPAN